MKTPNWLHVVLHWIFVSSGDPAEVSNTLKAGALTLFAAWFPVLQLIHIPVDSATITTVIVSGFAILQAFLVLVGAVLTFVGMVNKIVRTFTGNNRAMNALTPVTVYPTA